MASALVLLVIFIAIGFCDRASSSNVKAEELDLFEKSESAGDGKRNRQRESILGKVVNMRGSP